MGKSNNREIEMIASIYGSEVAITPLQSSGREPCPDCQKLLKLLEKIREAECRHYIEEGRKMLPLAIRKEIQKHLRA